MKRVLCVLVMASAPLSAQSLMYRSPNLSSTWVPDPAVVQFNFLHRFYVAPSSALNTIVNFPTFTLALGLPSNFAVGIRYATKSDVPTKIANEVEMYGRWQHRFGPEGLFTLAVTPAYNAAARSVDGEVGLDWSSGPVTVLGAMRGMTKAYGVDTARVALAAGGVIRINKYVGISGDVASLLASRPGESVAWSAAVVFVIPGSPHTFSLQVSNVDANTIEGSSKKGPYVAKKPLYGFEFTIPLHLNRFRPWFHGDEARQIPLHLIPSVEGVAAAEVKMQALHYHSDTLTIAVGQVVRWTNADPVEHTVAFDDGSGTSANIPQNGTFAHRFDAPGRYPYHCTQHPYMKGVVVVK